MAVFTDIVEESKKEVKQVYQNKTWQQVVIDIESIIDELNGVGVSGKSFHSYTADELSRMGGKLAVLRSSLVNYKMECSDQLKIARTYCTGKLSGARQQARAMLIEEAKKNKDKMPTADDVKAESEKYMVKSYLIRDFHENELERVQCHWYGIPNILYSIDTRIKVLQGDRDTVKFYGGDLELPVEKSDFIYNLD